MTPLDVTCVAKPSLCVAKPSLGCAGLAGFGLAWLGCVAGLGLASLGCVASLHFNLSHTPQVGGFFPFPPSVFGFSLSNGGGSGTVAVAAVAAGKKIECF